MKLIKGQWWTRVEARVLRQGTAKFRGYYGDYKVNVKEHGRELSGTFTFNTKTAQPIEVKLN
jgi:hypothetical protein